MVRDILLFVRWSSVSWGRATNGGFPFGASITQLMDIVAVAVAVAVDDCRG
jgi:hypothetical protein